MSDINEIQLTSLANVTQRVTSQSRSIENQNFLTLFMAQMNYQAPSPMPQNHSGATALSGPEGHIHHITTEPQHWRSKQALQASTLIGRQAHIQSTMAILDNTQIFKGALHLNESVAELSVTFYNPQGQAIQQLPLGSHPIGQVEFSWDGTDHTGKALPLGNYPMIANATIGGELKTLPTYLMRNIDSVTLTAGNQEMVCNIAGLGAFKMSEIVKIV